MICSRQVCKLKLGTMLHRARHIVIITTLLLPSILNSQQKPKDHKPGQRQDSEISAVTVKFPFEFRRIRLGITLDEAREALHTYFPPGKQLDPQIPELVACGDYAALSCKDVAMQAQSCQTASYCGDEYSGIMQHLLLNFLGGKLAEVVLTFPHDSMPEGRIKNSTTGLGFDSYSAIRLALLSKYGNCEVKQNDVQTKSGAHYTDEDSQWSRDTTTLDLEELCGSIDHSCLTMADKPIQEEFHRRISAARRPPI